MKKYLFFQFLFLLIFDSSIAQTTGLSNIVPPSPNASSLARYADVPVSNYTGVPNISVPLMDVKSGKVQVPVTLSYHSSGIKVAEEASWVGLGWALNAGGMITRQTRGLDDFKQQGGYIRTQLPPATAQNLPDWSDPTKPLPNTANFDYYEQHYYTSIESEFLDPEPDIFYYNFLQYSGKLVFEKQAGEIVKAISIDQNNLIFVYDINSKIWTVTDGNGWKFYLGSTALNAVETTTNYNLSSSDPITPNDDRISKYDPPIFDSAWYLTKIVTPEGDTINFLYENSGKTISQISRYEQTSDFLNSKDILGSQLSYRYIDINSRSKSYSASQQVINPVYLKKIEFTNGFVEFITEDRTDVRKYTSSDPNPKRLKTAKLFNLDGRLIKQVDFKYSYFSSLQSSNGMPIVDNEERKSRLRLDSLQESTVSKDNQILKIPPYIFSYNSTLLPEKTSYSLDYWGYNNGYNNNSIVNYEFRSFSMQDQMILNKPISSSLIETLVPFYEGTANNNIYLTGANREVNSIPLQAAILQKIQYPTGAIVNFEYEPNRYSSELETLYEDEPIFQSAKILGSDSLKMSEIPFTLDKVTMVHLSFNVYNLMANGITDKMTAALEDQNGKKLISIAPWIESDANKGSFNSYLTVFLPAGNYKLRVNNTSGIAVNIEAAARYVKKNPTTKKIGAGLRIKSITTNDKGTSVKKKIFSYENNNISTGRLISPYQFFYNHAILTNGFIAKYYPILVFQQINTYLVRCSDSAIPFGNSAQGSVIGYNEVNVSDVDSNNNNLGISKYFYKNEKELPLEVFIPGMPNLISLTNGQLLKEQHFNSNNVKVKEASTEYVLENTRKNIKGVRLYKLNETINGSTDIRFYDVFSEWWHPKTVTETLYDVNGNKPISTITNYDYENPLHKNLTKTTMINSRGQTVISKNKYPQDLLFGIDETTEATISSMTEANVIDHVIQSETTINGNLVQGTINNFKVKSYIDDNNVSKNMYLPKNIKSIKGESTNGYEKKVDFIDYGKYGNLVEYKQADGTTTVYLWGYKEEYLVAKVENATVATVEATLTGTELSNIKNGTYNQATMIIVLSKIRTALTSAMVTTYTYDPIVGITSITDPIGYTTYYEYDEFNRLKFVKDNNGKFLKKNEYHYKAQK